MITKEQFEQAQKAQEDAKKIIEQYYKENEAWGIFYNDYKQPVCICNTYEDAELKLLLLKQNKRNNIRNNNVLSLVRCEIIDGNVLFVDYVECVTGGKTCERFRICQCQKDDEIIPKFYINFDKL